MATKIFSVFLSFLTIFLKVSSQRLLAPEDHVNWGLLPRDNCGESSSKRIIGGEEAPLGAYPWIARIGYRDRYRPLKVYFLCGAVLINKRTVLTAAHCVKPNRKLIVSTIRFGEHNMDTDPDCNEDHCADPVVDIEPLEVIFAKNYSNPYLKNDIGLIRLKEEVKYTDYIKPICIGGSEFMKQNFVGKIAEVAGWGVMDIETDEMSDVLLTLKIPVVRTIDCGPKYSERIHIDDSQLCAGGEIGKDSCGGDSGGPLMIVDAENSGPRYYLLGLVSFGPRFCGLADTPGVYTRIPAHMGWILDNLKETADSSTVTLSNIYN